MRLTQDQIAKAKDLKTKIVNVAEWGGDVEIKVISVADQLELEKFISENPKSDEITFLWIMKSCINEDGTPLFTDINIIKNKSTSSVIKLFNEIIALNKQKDNDVEEMAKNS